MQSLDNAFHALYESVAKIFQDFTPSKCSLQLFRPDEASDESAMCKVKMTNVNYDPMTNISKMEKPVFTDVYKYRCSRNERAFVPPAIKNGSLISQTSSDEFIALSNNSDLINNKDFINVSKNERYVKTPKGKDEYENAKKTTRSESTLIDNNTDSGKHTGNDMSKKRKGNNITYLSLKIKRVQGNSNRIKATKFSKKRKK